MFRYGFLPELCHFWRGPFGCVSESGCPHTPANLGLHLWRVFSYGSCLNAAFRGTGLCPQPHVLLQRMSQGPAHQVLAPCMEGACPEVLPVLRDGVVAWAVGVLLRDVDVFGSQQSGDPGEEW